MNIQAVKRRFGIIGQSPGLDRALDTAIRVANTDLTVLIFGESGVGKEVFSNIIHSLSSRKHNNFIAINCGAIPEGTINSELFGHEKGAFTGATSERKGYFETVDSGTIFLDEIGEMPLDTQAYLLRILESGEFMRVGSSKVRTTDVRVIAATNIDLKSKIEKGKFREDLFYRLNTVPIQIPPLRKRKEDIPVLFRKFAVDFADRNKLDPIRLDDKAKELLKNYSWPGNIRELKNLAEQVSILSEKRQLAAEDLVDFMPSLSERHLPAISDKYGSESSFQEREILYKVLFDMKQDLNDLKSLVYDLINRNDLSVPESGELSRLELASASSSFDREQDAPTLSALSSREREQRETAEDRAILLSEEEQQAYDESEIVEESLSLEDMEKKMIKKALDKHDGKRKDAAEDLGISERTLYRKIKQYEL